MNNDALGDRMKNYENSFRNYLPKRIPVIIRVDGCHFHQLTKKCKKPFDDDFIRTMNETAIYLCENIHGAQMAYVQSDEISILLNNYTTLHTQPWFNNNIQKMASVSAGMASSAFTRNSYKIWKNLKQEEISKQQDAYFDSRIFLMPKEEVNNYFLWRQKDCSRNSVQMLARSLYSHNECNNKNNSQLQEMCFKKEKNWNNLATSYKRGRCIIKESYIVETINKFSNENVSSERSRWIVDNEIPIFSQNKDYINQFVAQEES
jgi:tRNA(His) 5'-end guanylyltransferase